MLDALIQLMLFSAKSLILVVLILLLFTGIIAILTRGKEKLSGKIVIKNINKKYLEIKESLLKEILPKDKFKKFMKAQKASEKAEKKLQTDEPQKNIYVLSFYGDIKASAVAALREEITAVISVASSTDEVVLRLESPGGMVHAYGLAAAQLTRLRDQNIPLTVIVDKVAASGGYLMASVANKILAAPFAIIGSIGVIAQSPNFHRFLKEKHIDYEQITAGNFKRTISLFGHNTEEGRAKLKEEIEEIHLLFKNAITRYRKSVDIEKVATGEHWAGTQAYDLKLIDEIKTSDDYLLSKSQEANLYEICFHTKKSLAEKLSTTVNLFKNEDYSSILMK